MWKSIVGVAAERDMIAPCNALCASLDHQNHLCGLQIASWAADAQVTTVVVVGVARPFSICQSDWQPPSIFNATTCQPKWSVASNSLLFKLFYIATE